MRGSPADLLSAPRTCLCMHRTLELSTFTVLSQKNIVSPDDVAGWLYSVGLLFEFCAFLGTLHWPSSFDDLGLGGATFLEMLILFENWTGERLGIELVVPKNNRNGRLVGISPVQKRSRR